MDEKITLAVIAQIALDLYLQDYPTETDFIRIEHAILIASMALAKLISEEYRVQKLLVKAQSGFSWVDMSPSWMIEEEHKVEKTEGGYEFKLDKEPMQFPYDSMGSGVQKVAPKGCVCGELIRISVMDEWKFCRLPKTDKVFYSVRGSVGKIISQNNVPSKVKVFYVPKPSVENADTYEVTIDKQDELVSTVLQKLLIAKQGRVIDKTIDGNPNTVPATEINTDSAKAN